MKLSDCTVKDFANKTASRSPAPGGGGVSAAVLSLSAALGDMVGEFTVGKKKYSEVENEITVLMERSKKLMERLFCLIDEDAENFIPLSRAYSIPKEDPTRDEELERCLVLAAKAPMEIFEISLEVTDILAEFAKKGSVIMVSDAATGAALARGAMCGAAVNVKANTKLMKNREVAEMMNGMIDAKLGQYCARADEIFYGVYRGM